MLAVVQTRYGAPSELLLAPVARPAAGPGEVRVRVRAASVNPADWFIVTGRPLVLQLAMGRPAPRVPIRGSDVSGIVDSVGEGVTRFSPGDEVFGWGSGSFAEYLVTSQDNLVHLPQGVDLVAAAGIPMAGAVALQAMRDHAAVVAGQKVLINGAAGGIGSLAVQIAKSMGATVTAVCSTGSVDLMRSLGADRVIDYTETDFTTEGVRYDVILDNAGNHSLATFQRSLTADGMLMPNNGTIGGKVLGSLVRVVHANLANLFTRQRLRTFLSSVKQQDLQDLAALLASGAVVPVVDRSYPLAEACAALDYIGQGHARGKVLLTV